MQNSIRVVSIPRGKAVTVGVRYGEEENRRVGVKRKNAQSGGQGTSHQFVEPSINLIDKFRFEIFVNRLIDFLRAS